MGIFNRIKDPVQGEAQIVGCSSPPARATSGSCRMQLVIQAPGIPAFSAEDTRVATVKRWPSPGLVVPVTIDRGDPSRFKLDLGVITDGRDEAVAQADQMAATMRGERPSTMGGTSMGANVQVIGAATPEMAAAAIRQAEMQVGMDLDGDGTIGGMTAAQAAGGTAESVVSQLERLAQLHRDGLLTREEFDRQKAGVLGE